MSKPRVWGEARSLGILVCRNLAEAKSRIPGSWSERRISVGLLGDVVSAGVGRVLRFATVRLEMLGQVRRPTICRL
jgi:hypothetical protein